MRGPRACWLQSHAAVQTDGGVSLVAEEGCLLAFVRQAPKTSEARMAYLRADEARMNEQSLQSVCDERWPLCHCNAFWQFADIIV
jgi:hypothetical protein